MVANSPSDSLREAVIDSCAWSTPLIDCQDRDSVVQMMDDFMGFVLSPVLLFTSEIMASASTVRLEWLLSFTYPLPWRPRITISAHSEVTLAASKDRVSAVVDNWDIPPLNMIRQALPRLSDILWFYPSPHAEIDIGTRKILQKGSGYRIVRVAARPQILIEGIANEKTAKLATAIPALPFGSFIGSLRRKEDYSTVSPVAVRCLGKNEDGNFRLEFAVPVPGLLLDENSGRATPLPPHSSPDARILLSPARRCAILRYNGYGVEELFEKKLGQLVEKLQADGHLPLGKDVDRRNVWSRSYDSKVGFNGASEMAIGTCGGVGYGIPPRWNEILIELPDNDDSEGAVASGG